MVLKQNTSVMDDSSYAHPFTVIQQILKFTKRSIRPIKCKDPPFIQSTFYTLTKFVIWTWCVAKSSLIEIYHSFYRYKQKNGVNNIYIYINGIRGISILKNNSGPLNLERCNRE